MALINITVLKDGSEPFSYPVKGNLSDVEATSEEFVNGYPSDITVIIDEWPPTIITTRNN